jgi:IS605 OrfB family transposase
MEQTLTIVCKLQPTTEQAAKMDALLKAFADGCNYANEQVKPGITSKTTIQSLVYQDIRAKFGLSANQAVRVCARVGANRKWLNHNISKQVIESAKTNNAAIAIEDLTGIRERTNQQPRDKTERRRANSWAFYQLRLFLEYKAVKAGIDLVAVPPAYTSQTCHACNHIGLRSGKRFQCSNCGWHGDADLNGAINISKLGAVFVSQPRGSNLCCSLNCDGSGLLQDSLMLCVGESPRASAGG